MATDGLETKAARNEALFREVNERILEVSDGLDFARDEPRDFLCECADPNCAAPIKLTYEEYEAVRSVPTRFPVKPGHRLQGVERAVETNDRYEVVEKFGEAGKIAAETDPRSGSAPSS